MTRWVKERRTVAGLAISVGMAGFAITGCGGGGGGGGTTPPPPPATYTITGQLYNHGAPAAGVPVTFDGLAGTATTTTATGNYTITLPKTAVTGSDHVTFGLGGATPVNFTVTEVSGVPQNVGKIYVVNGTILNNGNPASGLTINFDGNASTATMTDSDGKFMLLVPLALVTGTDTIKIVIVPGSSPVTQPLTEVGGVPQDFGTKDIGTIPTPPV